MRWLVLIAIGVLSTRGLGSTYDLLLQGKKCQEGYAQQIDCDYRIGDDFWLSITGVGVVDAGVTFMKSDFGGKYYGTYGLQHGCVVVKAKKLDKTTALPDFAFVSPRNGKIYKNWQDCKAGY